MSWRARGALAVQAVEAVGRAGLLKPVRPDRALRMGRAARLGVNAAGAVAAGAARHPDRAAVIDDDGVLTWAGLDAAAASFAKELRDSHGIDDSAPLAVMCRNGRGFVVALVAAARIGCDVVLLNTEFAAPQLAELLPRERVQAVVGDPEFENLLQEEGRTPFLHVDATVREARPPTPKRRGNVVMLTSGTTGTPKGAQRDVEPLALLGPMVTMMQRLRLRSGQPMVICPPLFHGLGLATLGLALFIGCPVVVRRRFDTATALADVRDHDAAALVVVPVMLRRLLDLSDRPATPSLRAVISGGSALAPQLGDDFMDEFGDVLFNVYGSTETGWSGVATPADLRAAPGTVGRPPIGVTVKIIRDDREVPAGVTGGIYVGGEMVMSGYTGGDSKASFGGLSSTGDLGHIDSEGRLFVEGRDDDMIVSGGENVFPQEVEETLARHGDVADVAVLGVDDDQFGQRLVAYVVARAGAAPDEDELKDWVRSNLARFKVPREVVFVDELPRTATGKVRKRDLRDSGQRTADSGASSAAPPPPSAASRSRRLPAA